LIIVFLHIYNSAPAREWCIGLACAFILDVIPIRQVAGAGMMRAFELAARFRRPAAYDAHYLALADYLECPLWTADQRLYNAVRADFPRIRWLGDYRAEGW